MSVSASTSRALHHTLGDQAAEDVIDRMNQMESSRAEHRELMELTLARFEDRIALHLAEFKHEVRDDIARVETHMAEFKHTVRDDIARLDVRLEKRAADLMRWSLVYWIGAVGAIAALARIVR